MGFGEEEEGKKRKKMMGLWEGSAPPRLGRRKRRRGRRRRRRGVESAREPERERDEMKWKELKEVYLYIYFRENYSKLPYYLFLIIFLAQKFIYIIVSISFPHNIFLDFKIISIVVSNSK